MGTSEPAGNVPKHLDLSTEELVTLLHSGGPDGLVVEDSEMQGL